MKKQKGITLVALVITIVILLILAGISISALTGKELFEKTQKAAEQQKISQYKESIELAKTEAIMEYYYSNDFSADIINQIKDIINNTELFNGSNFEIEDNSLIIITPDQFVFEVIQDVSGNVQINYISKADNIEILISFDANGGTGEPETQSKTYGKTLTLTTDIPVKEGYEFLGWSTDSEATSAMYLAGSTFRGNNSTILYAVWQEHNYVSEITVAATCTVEGVRTYTCTNCNDTYTEPINKIEHDNTATGNLRSAATCTEAATYWYNCSICGTQSEQYFESGSALGHNNTATGDLRSAATCTEAATYWYKCSRCGTQATTYFTSGNGTGHSLGSGTSSGTTTEWCNGCGGYNGRYVVTQTCSKCGGTRKTSYCSAGHCIWSSGI